ncbi:1-deoxy-D-xylulose-5-phosphate synthase [Clostridium aminobutyricum]|uniref:1-deoxy-D-xylulose-5-phosphate synthase n=1 Tax=Clostridium aminobutyricum TaxID=33953 RepID=A0A939D7K5_CLOAM|nr:1-deoxy-D-xylulose-5-phosphate synthase [Clostridium aminobutyricum]MBN7772520.1 1-deoxy-D-xylulose-5-phosphate synthase [Clostridium aminobutyricum]
MVYRAKPNLLGGDYPDDLKKMSSNELDLLSYEIRDFLIDNVSKTGGHLASNLGVVELTIALHTVFESPKDKIIWDVGHQSYIHKILTGRIDGFSNLRQYGGISGFPKREESSHDCFDTGHSSNSISAAAGIAAARDLAGEQFSVISVIGDGALTGGLAYEALNNVGISGSKIIVVINDNGMSISKNTGGLSQHLGKLRLSPAYLDFKKQVKKTLKGIPGVGENLYSGIEHVRDSVKYAMFDGALFEELGFKYMGPFDGHNIRDLIAAFSLAQNSEESVVLHVLTKKGKGYKNAETSPNKFHGIGPFNPTTGVPLKSAANFTYSQVFGSKMIQLADRNKNVVAISAAMIEATGLHKFSERFSDRIFDVGIAEGHAVSFAAGLAVSGFRPVVAIYSTFLQRAYDQMMIDVCMQNLPVVFAIDRAGNVGADGETHHGVFDLSYLNHMPNMTVLAPSDGRELAEMLASALTLEGPCAIRYPRGEAIDLSGVYGGEYGNILKSKVIQTGTQVEILAVGKMVSIAMEACTMLKSYGIDAGLINVRSVKPLDKEAILEATERTNALVTLEDNVIEGGFGQQVLSLLSDSNIHLPCRVIGWPDCFVEHGEDKELFKKYSLDATGIYERVRDFIERQA